MNSSQRQIGLDFVLEQVNTMTPFGTRRKRALIPYLPGDEAALAEEHDRVEELLALLRAGKLGDLLHVFCQLRDCSGTVQRLADGESLDEVEFFELKNFTANCQRIRREAEQLGIDARLQDLTGAGALLDPEGTGLLTFHYYDAWSPELADLRVEKRRLDRTGADPASAAAAQLAERLERAIRKVRQELSDALRPWQAAFRHNMTALGILDHRIAKADHARRHGCVRPAPSTSGELSLQGMIHPLVDDRLRASGSRMEPLDLVLTAGTTILTGANMGGKSVTLKTFLLQMELFRLGYFLPCVSARLRLPDFVSFSAGGGDDLASGLSSFGREVLDLQAILRQARTGRGIIVLDEPARGTNPLEGQAIVKALCRHFQDGEHYFFVASHLPDLPAEGMRHYQMMGLKEPLTDSGAAIPREPQAALAWLEERMDYRIREVAPHRAVPREAVRVMAVLGIDPDLLRAIEQNVGDDDE